MTSGNWGGKGVGVLEAFLKDKLLCQRGGGAPKIFKFVFTRNRIAFGSFSKI